MNQTIMKEEQKKLEFIRKTIFSYVEEMYHEDKFLIVLLNQYKDINNKILPALGNAERIKEIMKHSECLIKKTLDDCQPSSDFKDKLEKAKDVIKDFVSEETTNLEVNPKTSSEVYQEFVDVKTDITDGNPVLEEKTDIDSDVSDGEPSVTTEG